MGSYFTHVWTHIHIDETFLQASFDKIGHLTMSIVGYLSVIYNHMVYFSLRQYTDAAMEQSFKSRKRRYVEKEPIM
jgi:hypothetical protein